MTTSTLVKKLSLAAGLASVLTVSSFVLQTSAKAAVIRISESDFAFQPGKITFSEQPLNEINPTYAPAQYGGGAGAPTVFFGGAFNGQIVGLPPIPPAPGAPPSGVVNGNPNGLLNLDPASPNTFITNDATPTIDSPVLSGAPLFFGPISILFSKDVAGVGLTAGFFDAIGGTEIRAFGRNGALLGQVLNQNIGNEFVGLVTDDGLATIAGLQFSFVGPEPAGYAIDNVRFGTQIPTPALLPGLIGMGVAAWRKRKAEAQADVSEQA